MTESSAIYDRLVWFLSLPGDLLERIAIFTPPFATMKIITLDRNTAARFGYSPGPGLWKRKVQLERKGLVFDDSLVSPGGWYLYYRVINTRLEGGRAYLMRKSKPDTLIDSEVIECATNPLGNTVVTLTPSRARTSKWVKKRRTPDLSECVRARELENLGGLSRDGYRPTDLDSVRMKVFPDSMVWIICSPA